jgi:hypothetical protein
LHDCGGFLFAQPAACTDEAATVRLIFLNAHVIGGQVAGEKQAAL